MTEQEVEALLKEDATGEPWRPTPSFFDTLQRDMAAVDTAVATERPRAFWPMALAAGIGSAVLGAALWWNMATPKPEPAGATMAKAEGKKSAGETAANSLHKLEPTKAMPVAGAKPTKVASATPPAAAQPAAAAKPATAQPVAAGQPVAGQPVAGQPVAGQPGAPQPVPGQPAASGHPGAKKPIHVAAVSKKKKKKKPASSSGGTPTAKPDKKPPKPASSGGSKTKKSNRKANDLLSSLKKPKASSSNSSDSSGGSKSARLSSAQVKSVLRRKKSAFKACLKLMGSPPAGSITVRTKITIRGNGSVASARIISSGGTSGAVTGCIARKLKKLKFKTFTDARMTVNYPVRLQ